MEQVTLRDKTFSLYIPHDRIIDAVTRIADQMNHDLAGKDPLFVCVLNGAFMFAAELLKRINLLESEITFVKMASYRGTHSTGIIRQLIGMNEVIEDRTVVVLEDIVDSGSTIENIITQLKDMNPREIKLASLLLKPDALVKKVDLDYIGMEIPNDFIVGFGLDYDGYGRNLRDIYSVVEEQQQTGNMLNLVLFGPPGAGKGTQAEFLTESYKLIHLSTGDLLRSEIAGKTPLGMEAKRYMDKGELVPDAVVIGMIRSKLEANPGANGYVFDGFPRTVSQAEALDALLEEKGSPVSGMLSLEVERLELINRLLGRGLMSGRSDDLDQEVIENRIRVYGEKTAPLIEYYEKQGKYFSINGRGSILEIAGRLKNTVDKLVKN